jgi:hypothetical protein
MNAQSSRSHSVFQLIVTRRRTEGDQPTTRSTLFIVDLAGSEKVDKTGVTGERLAEAQKIFVFFTRPWKRHQCTDGREEYARAVSRQ